MWLSDLIRKIKYGKAPSSLPAIISAEVEKGENWMTINGKRIELPSTVCHGLVFQTIFVVVLDAHYNNMRNVIAFDGDGNQLWTIERPDFESEGEGYSSVGGDENTLVALARGVHFSIDPTNGHIYEVHFDKM